MTKPKKRGDPIAVSPGEASATSCSITCSAGIGASLRTLVTLSSADVRSARTGRCASSSIQSAERSATSCSSRRVSTDPTLAHARGAPSQVPTLVVVVGVDAVAEIIAAQGRRLEDEDGREVRLVLGPGLSDDEIEGLQATRRRAAARGAARRPALHPRDRRRARAAGLHRRGCDVALDDTFPAGLPIAADGYGNFWVLDLGFEARERARVFYICHDPPVVLYQAPSLADFLREAFRMLVPPHESLVDDVHEDRLFNIWGTDHGLLSHADALAAAIRRCASSRRASTTGTRSPTCVSRRSAKGSRGAATVRGRSSSATRTRRCSRSRRRRRSRACSAG